jgi:acyl-CoA synthetase (AMP-forming)/AMP-acid ligase II
MSLPALTCPHLYDSRAGGCTDRASLGGVNGRTVGVVLNCEIGRLHAFFHIYGMTVLLNLALRQRATLVTMPKFDLVEFLTNIQNRQCTYLFIAPPDVASTPGSCRGTG